MVVVHAFNPNNQEVDVSALEISLVSRQSTETLEDGEIGRAHV